MNNCTFAGRLGRDAETRDAGDTTVTSFSLAVDEYAGRGERKALWVDCSLWGERGEKAAEHLKKGKQVAVSGRVGVRTYEAQGETRAVITLRVADFTFMGGGERTEGGEPRQARTSQPQRSAPASSPAPRREPPRQATPPADFSDDDIPF